MAENKTDWKTPLIVIGAVVVVVIIFLIIRGFSKPSQEDIQISNFRYGVAEDSAIAKIPFNYNNDEEKGIKTSFTVTIATNKKNLFLKVYDTKNENELSSQGVIFRGENEIRVYDLYLYNLYEKPKLKFCISSKSGFNQYSKGVICETETFDKPPEFKYEIFPDPVTFLINEQDREDKNSIIIKNTGEINAPIGSGVFILEGYSKDYPNGDSTLSYSKESSCLSISALRPGESCEYKIIVNGRGPDLSPGTYEDYGFIIWDPFGENVAPLFKKEFTLKTIVGS